MNDEEEPKTETTRDNDEGVQPTADEEIKRINEETQRLNRAIAEKEHAEARAKLAGVTTYQEPEKPKEMSDIEYWKAAREGKFNKQ